MGSPAPRRRHPQAWDGSHAGQTDVGNVRGQGIDVVLGELDIVIQAIHHRSRELIE